MKTVVVNEESIRHDWFVVDASDMPLGRLASKAATVLIGKRKPAYSPNQDHGDHLIVLNSDRIKLTGKKAETKVYFRHSTHPGGGKFRTFKEQMGLDSTQVIVHAVLGMVPKKSLGKQILRKLHVYSDATHPHAAQKPQPMTM